MGERAASEMTVTAETVAIATVTATASPTTAARALLLAAGIDPETAETATPDETATMIGTGVAAPPHADLDRARQSPLRQTVGVTG